MSDDHETLEDRIRERAYHLWTEAECPEGRDEEFWFLAREAETGSLSASELSGGPSPAEEQLMAEGQGERQPDVQLGLDTAAKSDGMKPQDQATAATPETAPRKSSLEQQEATAAKILQQSAESDTRRKT